MRLKEKQERRAPAFLFMTGLVKFLFFPAYLCFCPAYSFFLSQGFHKVSFA